METGCDKMRRARPLLGTFVEIEATDAGEVKLTAAIDAAFDAVARVHRLMSFHEEYSDVSRLNRHAFDFPIRVDPWTYRVLRTAVDLRHKSGGKFDIAVAPVLQAMGMLPGAWDKPSAGAEIRTLGAIELLPDGRVGFQNSETRIDLGGIAKGFAVDRALEVLRDFGIPNGMVNAGGDLAVFGAGSQTISVRNPGDPKRVMFNISVSNEALASSARYFDPVRSEQTTSAAVIDPATLQLTGNVVGATVRAPSCMIADALTKIVMIAGMSASDLLEQYRASALLVFAGGEVQISSELEAAVSLAA
jgi:thiamine biosynthesis lipoprotein